jgi:transcriptional regulator with XRE-family HTH domain
MLYSIDKGYNISYHIINILNYISIYYHILYNMKPFPIPVSTDLLRTLVAARDTSGMSQAALGKHLGITQAQISRIERGLSNPQLSTVQNIAGALDLQLMLVPRPLGPVVKALAEDFTAAQDSSATGPLEDERPLYRIEAEETGADSHESDVIS